MAAAAGTPPNLLLVLSDDHSRPNLGCFGDTVIKTPNLDRFASESMRFEHAFQAAPQCVPSRAGLMTGRSPVAVRMGRFSSPLPPDVTTLPDVLRKNGYFTGIGRRQFHLDGSARPGTLTGDFLDNNGLRTFRNRVDWLDVNSPRGQTEDKVNEFLDRVPKGKPFFLWISFNDPHHPWDSNAIPEPHDPAKLKLPAHLPDLPGLRADLARHYDEISRMDAEFQSILDTLRRRGLADSTMVAFMGDNGQAFPHGKGSLYDPGLNVPLIVRWPGRVKPGSVSRELVSGEDIAPTFIAAAGLDAPRAMSGRSFLPLLAGQPFAARDHIFAARLAHGNSPMADATRASTFDLSRCVRTQTHKLIYNCTPHMEYWPVDSGNDPGWREMVAAHKVGKLSPEHDRAYFTRPRSVVELYDLAKDPSELHNVAGRSEYAAVQRQLMVKMQEKMILDYDFLPLPLAE